MSDFVICTDSACDIDPATLTEWGVKYCQLHFYFEGEEKEYLNYDMSAREFYANMRAGRYVRTSSVNQMDYEDLWEPILKEGNDILYIGFSSALSVTYYTAKLAAESLLETYPERHIICLDSMSASAGMGLLVYKAVMKKRDGATLDECAAMVEGSKMNMNHWFSVDDLKYLRKGGRLGASAAKVASTVGIKPVLNMDDNGKLAFKYVARGRKSAIKALVSEYAKRALKPGPDDTIFVCHSDCLADILLLQDRFTEEYGVKFTYIADVGPVIGSHIGPGVFSIFFEGDGRVRKLELPHPIEKIKSVAKNSL